MARTISCKAWNSPAEYPSRECKHHIKESEGNMYNPIFKGNVRGGGGGAETSRWGGGGGGGGAIITLTDKLSNALDDGRKVVGMFLDSSQAFDRHNWSMVCNLNRTHRLLWQTMGAPVSVFLGISTCRRSSRDCFTSTLTRYCNWGTQVCTKYLYPSTLLQTMVTTFNNNLA